MKSVSRLCLLIGASVFMAGGFSPAISSKSSEALQYFERAQQALRADGLAKEISRVEIVAKYTYLDDAAAPLMDRTVMEPPTLLHQERVVEGEKIERLLENGEGHITGPQGKDALEGEMLALLKDYFCIRQLQFLILCPGLELAPDVERSPEGQDIVRIHRDGQLFAELHLDGNTHRVTALHYPSDLLNEGASGMDSSEYSGFRNVDGWILPHLASGKRNQEPTSFYEVKSYRLVIKATE